MPSLEYLLLRILSHALLDPRPGSRRLGLELLLAQLVVLQRRVLAGHMSALLKARALEESVEPVVEVGELGLEILDAAPACIQLLAMKHNQ